MCKMSPDEVRDLLISKSISPEEADALREADFDGKCFWDWDEEDYLLLKEVEPVLLKPLRETTMKAICKIRDTLKRTGTNEVDSSDSQIEVLSSLCNDPTSIVDSNPNRVKAKGLTPGEPIQSSASSTSPTFNEKRQGPVRREQTRKFGAPTGETVHTFGNTIGTETGLGTLLEPAREFKEFDTEKMADDTALEEALVDRVGVFCFACLNSRCNGTLYLGIGDSTKGEYYDGFIKGVPLSENLKTKLQGIVDRHFTGRAPESLKGVETEIVAAVQNCIKPLQFIPVIKGTTVNNLYVVEVDVLPSGVVCKDLRFYMNVRKKKTPTKRKGKSNEITYQKTYYLREGTNSNSYKGDELKVFSEKVEACIQRRGAEEKEGRTKETSPMDRLENFLCRGRSSGKLVDSLKYILLSNGVPELETFEWIKNIDWFMVIDFEMYEDNDSETSKLYQHYIEDKIKCPTVQHAKDLTKCLCRRRNGALSPRDFWNALRVDENVLFILCSEDLSKDRSSWFREVLPGIRSLFMNLFNPERLESSEDVIVVTLVGRETRLEEMSIVIKELAMELEADQIAYLYEDSALIGKIGKNVEQCFGILWQEQAIEVVWSQLNSFMKTKTEKTTYSDHQVIASTGAMVNIPQELLELYQRDKVHILPANECEKVLSLNICQKEEYFKMVATKTKEFLSGKTPEWCVFFYSDPSSRAPFKSDMPPGIVERDITEEILKELDKMTEFKENCVARLCLNHHPGSGATTIGMGIMWILRKKMRCVVIDGKDFLTNDNIEISKIQRTAKRIIDFRAFNENEDVVKGEHRKLTCRTVFVLFDNSNNSIAKLLSTQLERETELGGIRFKRTMFLMLYLNRTFFSERKAKFTIEQALSDGEKISFASTLKALRDSKDVEPKNMLSFVIMAENFDEESLYVKGLIRKALFDINTMYPRQEKVLLYLAILKYFSNSSLPASHCRDIAFISDSILVKGKKNEPKGETVKAFKFRSFSPPAKLLLSEGNATTSDGSQYATNYDYLEITHKPVAYQLWMELVKDTTLTSVVKAMMSEKVLIKRLFVRGLIQNTFKKLLLKRDFDDVNTENEDGPSRSSRQRRKVITSNIIKYIIDHNGQEEAVSLLKFALEVLINDNDKAAVSQAIARIYIYIYQHKDDTAINEAKKFAAQASRLAPKNFAIRDTEGQVYKKHVKNLLERQKNDCGNAGYSLSSCDDIINAGMEASCLFRSAQDLYKDTKMQFGRSAMPQNIIDQTVIDHQDISNNYPGLLGQIETNLLVARCILYSTDLESTELREKFIKVLRKERVDFDLPDLFPGVEWDWSELHGFICDLFSQTEKCLQDATRKLTYNSIQLDNTHFRYTLKLLQDFSSEFRDTFGIEAGDRWRSYVGKEKVPKKAKLAYLRRFLSAGITISFGWVMRIDSWARQEYRDYLVAMAEIADSDAVLVPGDKISYANVYFSYIYHDSIENCQQLSPQMVKDFCEELVLQLEDADYPEPYFFYMMLFWPPMELSTSGYLKYKEVSPQRLELLEKCMTRLSQFEDQLADGQFSDGVYSHPKLTPIFYFQKNQQDQAALPLATAMKFSWKQINSRIYGHLNNKKSVVDIRFVTNKRAKHGENYGPCLSIRAANLYTKGKPWVTVNFVLAFTFSGPVAFGIKEEDAESRRIKEISSPKST